MVVGGDSGGDRMARRNRIARRLSQSERNFRAPIITGLSEYGKSDTVLIKVASEIRDILEKVRLISDEPSFELP
jgi:hypothetical protein